jgi:DNA polymerase elongation subunit (family B)
MKEENNINNFDYASLYPNIQKSWDVVPDDYLLNKIKKQLRNQKIDELLKDNDDKLSDEK